MSGESLESKILSRFAERTLSAGGPRVGFVLRRQALAGAGGGLSTDEIETGVGHLVEKGLVSRSEGGMFVFLTEAGRTQVAEILAGPKAQT